MASTDMDLLTETIKDLQAQISNLEAKMDGHIHPLHNEHYTQIPSYSNSER
jgi:hypothetical protein